MQRIHNCKELHLCDPPGERRYIHIDSLFSTKVERELIETIGTFLSLPMKCSAQRKCKHCSEFYLPDRRNGHHQRYCSEPACRKHSKAESQRRWLQKPDNQNYFCGSHNSQRVKAWRQFHPGYWRKKKSAPHEPLQEVYSTQVAQNQEVTKLEVSDALQEVLLMQPAVMVGLISTMSGSALQEDIAATTRALLRKGQDILAMRPRVTTIRYDDENQTGTVSGTVAPCATPV